jgi:galactoside O-acetyltransferase
MGCPPELKIGQVLPERVVRRWLKRCGQEVKLYRGCRIVGAERVALGSHVQIDEGVFIFAGQGVVIGHCVHLAVGSSISGGGECVIGDFAGIGAGVRLLTGTEEIDRGGLTNPTVPPELRTVRRGRVEIGAHALVLTNSVVLPDITIGEGAVVGAGSVVHHDLKPWGIYAGTPLVQVGVREAEPVLKKAQEALGIADLR